MVDGKTPCTTREFTQVQTLEVTTSLKLNKTRKPKQSTSKFFDYKKLEYEKSNYENWKISRMANRPVPNQNEDVNVENTWHFIKTTLYEGACELAVKQKTPKKDWLSIETKNLQADRRAAKNKIRTTKKDPNIARQNSYKSLNTKARKSALHDKNAWLEYLANEANMAANMGDQRKLYQISNTITGKSSHRPLIINDKNGKTIDDQTKRQIRWIEYFDELLNREKPTVQIQIDETDKIQTETVF